MKVLDPDLPEAPVPEEDERPPILGSWNRLYLLVLVLHALIILLFYLFTRYYS